jgi:hypothetical protein
VGQVGQQVEQRFGRRDDVSAVELVPLGGRHVATLAQIIPKVNGCAAPPRPPFRPASGCCPSWVAHASMIRSPDGILSTINGRGQE